MEFNFCDIEITKDIKKANCITHSGTFHADEVFASAILSLMLDKIVLYRASEIKQRHDGVIVYDVGLGKLDHHQIGGNGKRKNGVSYAACGLVWKKYYKDVLMKIGVDSQNINYIKEQVDKNLIQFIDANDNGITPKINCEYKFVSLANIIAQFNPNWNENIDSDINFLKAVDFSKTILQNEILSEVSKLKAKSKVEKAIDEAENNIMILDEFMPWKEFILQSTSKKAKEILYIIFPSKRGGYNIYAVPKEIGSFENRKNFPKSWGGLRDEELQKVTGIKTATFCHIACFICTTKTKDDAIKLANLARNSD